MPALWGRVSNSCWCHASEKTYVKKNLPRLIPRYHLAFCIPKVCMLHTFVYNVLGPQKWNGEAPYGWKRGKDHGKRSYKFIANNSPNTTCTRNPASFCFCRLLFVQCCAIWRETVAKRTRATQTFFFSTYSLKILMEWRFAPLQSNAKGNMASNETPSRRTAAHIKFVICCSTNQFRWAWQYKLRVFRVDKTFDKAWPKFILQLPRVTFRKLSLNHINLIFFGCVFSVCYPCQPMSPVWTVVRMSFPRSSASSLPTHWHRLWNQSRKQIILANFLEHKSAVLPERPRFWFPFQILFTIRMRMFV